MNGYVKIHRKLLDNPIVCKDSEYFAVWFYLLLNATHKNMDALFKGKRITLEPGQLITGTISISKKMKINKDKVQRILKAFEIDKQIAQQPSNKNRLITILNWDLYQNIDKQNDKQLINNCETTDKQLITNNNDKNVKNEINIKENTKRKVFVKPTLDEVKEYCKERSNAINPITFINYYESNGWKVGKNPMKDWKACIRSWETKDYNQKPQEQLPEWFNKNIEKQGDKESSRELEEMLKEFK